MSAPGSGSIGAASWTDRSRALRRVVEAQARLDAADAEQRASRDARDAALRAAREHGWTYDELTTRLGISSTTITAALRRTS